MTSDKMRELMVLPLKINMTTVIIQKILTPQKTAVIISQIDQCGFTIYKCIQMMQKEW